MSTGAAQAGIDVVFAVESDRNAATAYRCNHPRCDIFADDIRRLPSSKIRDVPRGSSGAIVFGGPPCQGFSYSNTRTRTVDNENNWLFKEFVRVVEVWQPDFFVFENVQGITNTARGLFLGTILDQFARLKYDVSHGLLNALTYGVPQDRSRFFLVGSKTGKAVMLPQSSRSKPLTVHDAIADLPSLTNGAAIEWAPYGNTPPSKYADKLRNGLAGCASHLVSVSQKTPVPGGDLRQFVAS